MIKHLFFALRAIFSKLAQRKRAGPITQRSKDRNLSELFLECHFLGPEGAVSRGLLGPFAAPGKSRTGEGVLISNLPAFHGLAQGPT